MSIRLKETPQERQKAARESAVAVLLVGDNRFALVLACLASGLMSFVSYFVAWAISLAIAEITGTQSFGLWLASQLLTILCFVLFAMPLWLGTYRMAMCLVDGQGVGTEDLFYYIGSKRLYTRALGVSLRLLWCWLPAIVGFLVVRLFFDFDFIGFLLVCMFAITLVLSMLFVSGLGGFVTLALTDESLSLDRARWQAASCMAHERMCVLRFELGMAWRVLLSLIPVGVPLLLHTLPESMLSAVCYSRRMAARANDEFENFSIKEF